MLLCWAGMAWLADGLEWEWEQGGGAEGGGNSLFWGVGNGKGTEVGMLLCWSGMAWHSDGLKWEWVRSARLEWFVLGMATGNTEAEVGMVLCQSGNGWYECFFVWLEWEWELGGTGMADFVELGMAWREWRN